MRFFKKSSQSKFFFRSRITNDSSLNNYSDRQAFEYVPPHVGTDSSLSRSDEHLAGESNISLRFPFVVFSLGIFFLISRLVFLQIWKGDHYRALAEGNRIRTEYIPSTRGVMYDRTRTLLVKNIPDFYIEAVPGDLYFKTKKLVALRKILDQYLPGHGVDFSVFYKPASRYDFQAISLVDGIPHSTALLLAIQLQDIPGVKIATSAEREYLAGNSFSHLLGYTGKINDKEKNNPDYAEYVFTDTLGKTGIELSYEKILRGVYGTKEIEVDSLGREKDSLHEKLPVPGKNLLLTIDLPLQQYLSDRLVEATQKIQVSKAAAVALNPNNGEVLALVTLPQFDNNIFHNTKEYAETISQLFSDENTPLLFRPLQGTYPSGSTFKPVVASAALQEGVITPSTTVQSTGGLHVGQSFFPDWKPGGHGTTDVYKAIAQSVNTYFYIIGGGYEGREGLGVDRITQYARMFGFGSKTNIDVPGEASGFLPTKEWKQEKKGERWYIGDTYHYAIGQGDLLVTPLQIANSISTIVNGGKVYRPHVVDAFLNQQGEVEQKIEPIVDREGFIDARHLEVVKRAMREAVLSGSARSLSVLPVSSGGKTGTAQFGSLDKKTHSWFVGFAPYENPEVVIVVMVEEGGGGNDIALPVARETLQWYFERKLATKKP